MVKKIKKMESILPWNQVLATKIRFLGYGAPTLAFAKVASPS